MKKLLSLILPVLALAGGIAGGEFLRPAETAEAATSPTEHGNTHVAEGPDTQEHAPADAAGHDQPAEDHGAQDDGHGEASAAAFFTFPSQFFVPMMRNGDMGAIMILTLSIETDGDELEVMKQQEHRLRDALLRQLLIHANTGGFDGNFTSEASMRVLREGLLKAAKSATTLPVKQMLIEDIARQEN